LNQTDSLNVTMLRSYITPFRRKSTLSIRGKFIDTRTFINL